jgi:hypothetical protein
MKIVKAAATDLSQQVANHERRIAHLEAASRLCCTHMLLIPTARSAMRLLEVFDNPVVPACYMFNFDAINQDGSYVAFELSEDGYELSRWTAERYEPGGDNAHLGYLILLRELGDAALDRFFSRLSIPDEWEAHHQTSCVALRAPDGSSRAWAAGSVRFGSVRCR